MTYRGDRARGSVAVIVGLSGLAWLVVVPGAPAGPPPGPACSYESTTKELTVTNAAGGYVFFSVDSGDVVLDAGDPLVCAGGTPTVTNVDHIGFTDTGIGQDSWVGITAPATFAPGATDAGDGILNPNEIEWDVDLGDGSDWFTYYASGDPGGARVTVGTLGINHNVSDNALANDRDVEVAGVDLYQFEGGNLNDGISGAGTQGTGDPVKRPFDFPGPAVGIYGGSGNDYIVGGSRDDTIAGSWNADYIAGGNGEDLASWFDATDAVAVDIGDEVGDDGGAMDASSEAPFTARDTVAGDIEHLVGGDFDDALRGSAADNVLTGGLGADRLLGRGGTDLLKAKDLIADLKLSCGAGDDRNAKRDPGLDPTPKSC